MRLLALAAAAVVAAYFIAASLWFRFSNPGLSETELFLSLPAAMLWKDGP